MSFIFILTRGDNSPIFMPAGIQGVSTRTCGIENKLTKLTMPFLSFDFKPLYREFRKMKLTGKLTKLT